MQDIDRTLKDIAELIEEGKLAKTPAVYYRFLDQASKNYAWKIAEHLHANNIDVVFCTTTGCKSGKEKYTIQVLLEK